MASRLRWSRIYNEKTKPVWLTLLPIIFGGGAWAGYVGIRTLHGSNDIVLKTKEVEPYLAKEMPKLLGRTTGVSQTEKWDKDMEHKKGK